MPKPPKEFTKGDYPKRTPVVLGTRSKKNSDKMEYRVGIVTFNDFQLGLYCRGLYQHRLNPQVARKCFGSSPVFFDKEEAIREALPLTFRASCGIKVLNFNDTWPGTDCQIVTLNP